MRPEKCQRCAKFYDAEKYQTCPFCHSQGAPANHQSSSPANEKHIFNFGKKAKDSAPVQNNVPANQNFYELNTVRKTPENAGRVNPVPGPSDDAPTMMLNHTTGDSPTVMFERTMGESPTVMLEENETTAKNSFEINQSKVNVSVQKPETLKDIPDRKPDEENDLRKQINEAVAPSDKSALNGKTVAFYDTPDNKEPVVGWLVCIKGSYLGESFELHSGKNHIGRSLNMTVALAKEKTVSREKHATITFDPIAKEFYLQAGDSSGLTYLNGKILLMPETIKKHDVITLGECSLVFIPLCGENFDWNKILSL